MRTQPEQRPIIATGASHLRKLSRPPSKTARTLRDADTETQHHEPLVLNDLDIAIIRLMYRGRADSLAGIEPRLNASQIAKSLRAGRSRVAGRLQKWVHSGFLSKYAVWLNPALFGCQGASAAVQAADPGRKPELIRQLSLIDGLVSATEFLGSRVNIGLVGQDRSKLDRILELIRGLVGVEEVGPRMDWTFRGVRRALTPLEVRLIEALRAKPTASLKEGSRQLGVSERTFSRKYSALIEESVVWFQPVFDFRTLASPLIVLRASIEPGAGRDAITEGLRSCYPLMTELADENTTSEPSAAQLEWAVVLPSAACIDEAAQRITSLEGVLSVEGKLPVRTYDFPGWFDERLRDLTTEPEGR